GDVENIATPIFSRTANILIAHDAAIITGDHVLASVAGFEDFRLATLSYAVHAVGSYWSAMLTTTTVRYAAN
ncbi:hypothetical protein, partial [Pantoea ananatis]|uniref:hypothetical protein n=1 Tax=Pantoea ananas TaxID=553 RepID=UPI001B30FE7C